MPAEKNMSRTDTQYTRNENKSSNIGPWIFATGLALGCGIALASWLNCRNRCCAPAVEVTIDPTFENNNNNGNGNIIGDTISYYVAKEFEKPTPKPAPKPRPKKQAPKPSVSTSVSDGAAAAAAASENAVATTVASGNGASAAAAASNGAASASASVTVNVVQPQPEEKSKVKVEMTIERTYEEVSLARATRYFPAPTPTNRR